MHLKKTINSIFCVLIFLVFAVVPVQAAQPPDIKGETAVLIDPQNLQVLYQKDMNRPMYPASTTKILTGIIALEKGNLNDLVTVSREAANTEGTNIGLQEGEQLTLNDLLYALMLNSANDAAEAIAEHIGGSINGFVAMMNKKAREIGAVHSHFDNPHGLPDEKHYTTAYDLALISRYAMQNDKFREIVRVQSTTINRNVPGAQTNIVNHNKLLWKYKEAIGIKTGYTNVAGQTIVAEAKRGDRELIAVVLKSIGTSIWTDSEGLLRYGFDNFKRVHLMDKGKTIARANVKNGIYPVVNLVTAGQLSWDFPVNFQGKIENRLVKFQDIKAPVKKGQKLGEIIYNDGEKDIGHVDLVAEKSVSRKTSAQWWFWSALSAVFLFLLFTGIKIYRRLKMRYRRWKF